MKTRPIRVGDKVRVLRDRFIKRIGYPLVWYDLMDEVEADPRTAEALRVLGFAVGGLDFAKPSMPREFVTAVAKMRVEERGFGGGERQIFYEEPGGHAWRREGSVWAVRAKRTAMTGTYYPPRSGRSYDGEPWDEPGGLENRKTHIILTTVAGEIEACDVELVTP